MIKFNNFPPEKAGDAEFTPFYQTRINELNEEGVMLGVTPNLRAASEVSELGKAVGSLLFHAVTSPHSQNNTLDITEDLVKSWDPAVAYLFMEGVNIVIYEEAHAIAEGEKA